MKKEKKRTLAFHSFLVFGKRETPKNLKSIEIARCLMLGVWRTFVKPI
jgi:hypothetical protein